MSTKTEKQESTALEAVTSYTPAQLFQTGKAHEIIAAIRKEALSFAPDLSTDASRKQIASVAAKVAKAKVAIDAAGKSLVDPIKAQAKVIDEERRTYKDALESLKAEVRKPLTDWEEARAKIEAEQKQRLFELEKICETTNTVGEIYGVKRLEDQLELLARTELTEEAFGPHLAAAQQIAAIGSPKIRQAIATRRILDEHEAAAKAANAETPEQRAKRERGIAERAAQAERDKQAAEAKRKADADAKRAADEEHVRKIKNEAYQSLKSALPDTIPQEGVVEVLIVVTNAIAEGKVRHVAMQF